MTSMEGGRKEGKEVVTAGGLGVEEGGTVRRKASDFTSERPKVSNSTRNSPDLTLVAFLTKP